MRRRDTPYTRRQARWVSAAIWCLACLAVQGPARASAQAGPVITEVRIEQEGQPITDRLVTGLIETAVGEPLSMREVRETITHLTSLNRYEDVQVFEDTVAGGVRLRYVLVPIHAVDRIEFEGMLGVPEAVVRREVSERFTAAPPAGRLEDVRREVQDFYRNRGYAQARIAPRIVETHDPDRASMVIEIDAGRRATIGAIDVGNIDAEDRDAFFAQADVKVGQAYDADVMQRALTRYESALRARGYYEARATHFVSFDPEGAARVAITLERGPHVAIAFTGDPIPANERDRLVPARTEASVDEDLLEDSNRAIEGYFKTRGYRDALVEYTRTENAGELTIAFDVSRGPRYVLDRISVMGNALLTAADVSQALALKPESPFVQEMLDAGVAALRNLYRSRGFTRADVRPAVATLPPAPDAGGAPVADRQVEVTVTVVEGPRTLVGSVEVEGNTVLTEGDIRGFMTSVPGGTYSDVSVAVDRDRIDLEYRNRGYDGVVIDPRVTLAEEDTHANLRFTITEGPQAIVDQVIVLGNQRISTQTIEREITLRSGQPLGYSAVLESQQRLAALGLFRRIQITQLQHAGEARRDVLVQVEEAPPNTVGYGGGVEGGTRLRPTGENGQAEDRFEVAPRGFFEVGRRNLWGKNRAVNLFTRVSLRSRDIILSDDGERLDEPAEGSGYGFNEYRVFATYREPRVFNTAADVLITGILDQAIRSSFNFITREVRAEVGLRVTQRFSLSERYSFEHTRLFDERFTEDEEPLIDRLFPQVRISKFSTALIEDTRDDLLYPNRGTFTSVEGSVATRGIGSEVGFVKSFVQGFAYRRLPTRRRMVLGVAARVGAAHGFPREVPLVGPDDQPITGPGGRPLVTTVQDLPASERFFAGGDSTVRGFALDRLGNEQTISPSGFPTGGNGLIVLNAELHVAVVGAFEGVGFVDAGNVFPRATDLTLTDLRPAAGFGVRYKSPVGPIRIDLGFNLDRRELVPGQLERSPVLHISLGQAF